MGSYCHEICCENMDITTEKCKLTVCSKIKPQVYVVPKSTFYVVLFNDFLGEYEIVEILNDNRIFTTREEAEIRLKELEKEL